MSIVKSAIVKSAIKADEPSPGGNIYPKSVLDEAIKIFNNRAKARPVPGGILNRKHIQQIGEVTHRVKRLFLDDDEILCAEVEFADTPCARKLDSGCKLLARPIMSLPSHIVDNKSETISMIGSIMMIQLEAEDMT